MTTMIQQSTIETFNAERQYLLSIAYRMLGSLSEAEDIVQEVWVRWQTQDAAGIQSPQAWLRSATRRLCIDQLRSARHQREDHYGVSLPEPSLPVTDAKADMSVERENSLTMAFTLMQENLKPVERAVFLLREVFDYDYADTAAIVGKTEANCRQIVRRAKVQLQANPTPLSQPNEQAHHLVEQFVSAAATGEVNDLLALVKEEVPLPNDGGDRAKAKCGWGTRAHTLCKSIQSVVPAAHARRASCSRASASAESDTPTSVPSNCGAS